MFDRVVSISMLLVGISTVFSSDRLPKPIFGGQLGPGVFPKIIGVCIVIVSILLAIENQKQKVKKTEVKADIMHWERNLWISVGSIVIYLLVFKSIGFILSGFLLICALGYLLGARKWLTLLSISILFPAAIYFGFEALGISLPPGLIPL
jgi:putative tricarboxylic transport membrane protein